MTTAERLETAAAARVSVGRVLSLLERPTLAALDEASLELAAAVTRVQNIQDDGPGAELTSSLLALRKDVRRGAALLRRAWEFRAAGSGQAAYTRTGELTARPEPAGRLNAQG
jgi:hypothetical protein